MTATAHPAAPPLSDRFDRIADALCVMLLGGMHPACALAPVMRRLHGRVRLIQRVFARFAALARAGVLPAPRAPRSKAATPDATDATTPNPTRRPPEKNLYPRGLGWLSKLFPWRPGLRDYGAVHANNLRVLLTDPEAEALLRAAPRLRRLLRPLCRALGAHDIPALQSPPRRPRPPKPKPVPLDPSVRRPLTAGQVRWLLLTGRKIPRDGMWTPATDGRLCSRKKPPD